MRILIKDRDSYIVFGVILLAITLRLIALSVRPLWYDEAFSILFSEKGLRAMLQGTLAPTNGVASDVHPLGYYTLLWGWMRVFGQSLIAVRMLSILFGTGVVLIAYKIGRSVFGKNAAITIALLVAISPYMVHYAQEVRMYAMMTFFLLMATLAMLEGMLADKWYWWVLFSISAVTAQYTHNLAGFYLLPLAFTPVLYRRWKAMLHVCLAGLVALFLYLPWLLFLPAQFSKVQQSYWTDTPTLARLITTLLSFTTNLPLPDNWLPVGLFIMVFVVFLAVYQSFKAMRYGSASVIRGIWFAYLAFTPPVLLFIFSQWKPIYIERALLPSGVMFLIWLGWVITKTRAPRLIQAMMLLILVSGMILGLYIHITYRGFPYAPFPELIQSVSDEFRTGDVILHSNKLTMLPSVYYDRDVLQSYLADPPDSGSDTLALPTQRVLGLIAQPSLELAVNDAERVWFIIFSRAIDEYKVSGYSTHPHLKWLNQNYSTSSMGIWGEVYVYEYNR